jgi:hypothetical protein
MTRWTIFFFTIAFLLLGLTAFTINSDAKESLSKQYIMIDGFKHSTRHELFLKSNSKFILKERNFKGKWRTDGTWSVSGDTLTLYSKTKTMKAGWIYKKKDKKEFLLIKKFIIVKGGLKEDKNSDKLLYYTLAEWKKRGKPTDVFN